MRLLITADWHLRESIPKCRTDDFLKAQWRKVDYIGKLAQKYDCSILHAGDLFDHWKPSPYLLTETIRHIPGNFCTILGNHDLPQHNRKLVEKSGVKTLEEAKVLTVLDKYWWGDEPKEKSMGLDFHGRRAIIWHVMTYQGKTPWPGCVDLSASEILNKYKTFDLIITGHNHRSFVEYTDTGQLLINPGSITRQSAGQENHKPVVYIWNSEDNSCFAEELPFEKNVISREHIDTVAERDSRIEAFIEQLNKDWVADISFEENLLRFEKENNIGKPVMEIIWKSIGR